MPDGALGLMAEKVPKNILTETFTRSASHLTSQPVFMIVIHQALAHESHTVNDAQNAVKHLSMVQVIRTTTNLPRIKLFALLLQVTFDCLQVSSNSN